MKGWLCERTLRAILGAQISASQWNVASFDLPSGQIAVQSSAMLWAGRTGMVEFLLLSLLTAPQQILPKPQIASAEGKPVPDITLKDQNGKTFRLASLRGKRVLLLFYRGYW